MFFLFSSAKPKMKYLKKVRKRKTLSSPGNPAAMSGSSRPLAAGVSLLLSAFIQKIAGAEYIWSDISATRLSQGDPLGFPSHPRGWFSIIVYRYLLLTQAACSQPLAASC
jgi:hypothetical protein